ncbi:hypothetical protein AB0M43_09210 [Longispora sp. NPDC051575]|uniref:hypothetical protein n=1 Tax=Longispora sp. NPDC051575 TaxID=3154943 RepID=UPI003419FEB0
MITLIRTRLTGYVRSQVALGPLLGALVVYGLIYSGGAAPAANSFGASGLALFGLLAWQTKALLDVEPDGQRYLTRIAVGARREGTAGLLAALGAGLALIPPLLAAPLALELVTLPDGLGAAIGVGLWTHLLAVPPAVALGAWASRAVTRSVGLGVLVLVGGVTLVLILGRDGSPVAFLVPPVMAAARNAAQGAGPGAAGVALGHMVVWTAVAVAGYARARVRNA